MEQPEDAELVRRSAARLYGAGQRIWDPGDRWNSHKRKSIEDFARAAATRLVDAADRILDAGCGCEPYEWLPGRTISLDRFWMQLRGRSRPVAGDLGALPLQDASMDLVVCIASVLNYVSAAEAISEIARVTRPGGHLLLHFETSTSFEQFGHRRWGDSVVRIDTINGGHEDTLWIYRPSYVASLLSAVGFQIQRERRFHILSALGLRLGLSQHRASPLSALDRVLAPLGAFADDVILLCERRP